MRSSLASKTHSVLEDHRRMNESIAALESVIRTEETLAGAPRGVVGALLLDLRQQHATILAALDRSRDALPSALTQRATMESWAQSVRAVLAEVRTHEKHEDELLLTALEGGRGAPD